MVATITITALSDIPPYDGQPSMTIQARALVSGWTGAANVGDELIFRSLIRSLASRDIAIAAMSVDPGRTRSEHGVDAIGWWNFPEILTTLRSVNGLILGPGGILQDETSIWNLPAHLHRVYLARLLRTPVWGVGLGAGPLQTRTGRTLVRSALGGKEILVRDRESAQLLVRTGVHRVTTGIDLAFGLPVPAAPARDRIIVSLRPFAGSGGILPARTADRRALRSQPEIDRMASALDELAGRTNLPIHFLAFEPKRDAAFHQLIASAMESTTTSQVTSVDTVFDDVAASRLVVGMRYHAVVAAVMAARPVVVVGYSPKSMALARRLGAAGALVGNTFDGIDAIPAGADLTDRVDSIHEIRDELRSEATINERFFDRLAETMASSQVV